MEKEVNLFFTITKTIEGKRRQLGNIFWKIIAKVIKAHAWCNTCYIISIVCTLIYYRNEPISKWNFTQLL